MAVFLVGGAVRDLLLNRPVQDKDYVVTETTPEQMLKLGYKQVGADFPVFLHPESGDEYALARTERKSGEGYHGFDVSFGPDVTLEEDLGRRDLTVNAMAMNSDGDIVDPFNGRDDLAHKVFRHVSEAFEEDPVRVLRVARFMARHAHEGWSVHPETLDYMTQISRSGELAALTQERVWKELSRALMETTPSAFIKTLRDCEALQFILPEVDALFGVPQPKEHHPEVDTGIHTLLTLDQAAKLSDRLEVRFGALVRDLGKALSEPNPKHQHIGHEKAGVPLVEALCDRLKTPSAIKVAGMQASEHHLRVHRALELSDKKIVSLVKDLGYRNKPHQLRDLVAVSEADARGRTGLEDRPYPQADYLIQMAEAVASVNQGAFFKAADGNIEKAKQELHKAQLHAVKSAKARYRNVRETESPTP